MKRFLFLLMFIAGLASCVETTWVQQEYPGGILLNVPDYMTPSKELSPDALVQLENKNRELYFLLQKKSKTEFASAGIEFDITPFSKELMKTMLSELKKAYFEEEGPVLVNGLKGYRFSVGGKSKVGPAIDQQVLVVEKGEDFYVLTAWTTSGSKTNWYNNDLRKLMDSFRLK